MSWILVLVAVALVLGVLVSLRRWRLPGSAAPPLPDLAPGEALRRGAGPPPPQEQGGLRAAMARTREAFRAVFGRSALDEATWADLEEALLRADVGATMTATLLAELRAQLPSDATPADARVLLRARVAERLNALPTAMAPRPAEGPFVVLVVGVNGSGKTTSIGKLAARWTGEGHRVVLGAADTFRAGAIDQLRVWAERAGVDIVAHQEGADPGAVCHDTLQAARARGHDTVLCDTAGRLQAHRQLMDELAKVRRVLGKGVPGAPHEVLLVLDATMGQNALSQARLFQEVAGVTGIVLTKLDGTARGGVVLAIAAETGVPVKWVGVGERVEDLRPFDASAFVEAWFADAG
ncbi:MAG: signal recognition particle-docking protein FtsY [Pseudomonadota bacterium]